MGVHVDPEYAFIDLNLCENRAVFVPFDLQEKRIGTNKVFVDRINAIYVSFIAPQAHSSAGAFQYEIPRKRGRIRDHAIFSSDATNAIQLPFRTQ